MRTDNSSIVFFINKLLKFEGEAKVFHIQRTLTYPSIFNV